MWPWIGPVPTYAVLGFLFASPRTGAEIKA